jgi:hypothetical protein
MYNQNQYIEEEQTTQWPKEKVQKDKQRSTKHTHKTRDRVIRTPLITWGELMFPWRVSSSCSTSGNILSNAYSLYILWALSNTNKTNQVRWFHLRICCQQINKKQLLYAIVYLHINRWILYLYINVIKSVNTVRPQHTRVYVARGIRSVLPIKKTIFNSW